MNVGLNLMCNCAIRIYCSMLVAVVPSYLRRCETVSLQYLQLLLFCSPCCNYQLSVRFLLRFELQAELLMKSHQRPTQPGSDAHWDWDTGHVLFYCPAWLNQEAARLIICQFHLFQYFFFFYLSWWLWSFASTLQSDRSVCVHDTPLWIIFIPSWVFNQGSAEHLEHVI